MALKFTKGRWRTDTGRFANKYQIENYLLEAAEEGHELFEEYSPGRYRDTRTNRFVSSKVVDSIKRWADNLYTELVEFFEPEPERPQPGSGEHVFHFKSIEFEALKEAINDLVSSPSTDHPLVSEAIKTLGEYSDEGFGVSINGIITVKWENKEGHEKTLDIDISKDYDVPDNDTLTAVMRAFAEILDSEVMNESGLRSAVEAGSLGSVINGTMTIFKL